jgi:glycerol-3-phosphate acyltransferase PlsY
MLEPCLVAGTISYLLGSIPFGLILLLVFRGVDVRQKGSGNIGAANVARIAPGLGLLTLLLDAAKGFAGVMIAGVIVSHSPGIERGRGYIVLGTSALCAVAGHMVSVWLRFRGGKGIATGLGACLALLPITAGLALLVYVLVFASWRYSSLASITAAFVFPMLAYVIKEPNAVSLMPFLCALSLVTIAKHHQNVRRLLSGTESRFALRH